MPPEIPLADLLTFHFFVNTLNNEEFQYYQFNIQFQDSKSKVISLRFPGCVKNSSRWVPQSAVLGISFCFWQKMLKKIILTANQKIRNTKSQAVSKKTGFWKKMPAYFPDFVLQRCNPVLLLIGLSSYRVSQKKRTKNYIKLNPQLVLQRLT